MKPESTNINKQSLSLIVLWAAVIILSVLLFHRFMTAKYYQYPPDVFYYMAIADNLHEHGVFQDASALGGGPVITPQNGIVGILWFFRSLGLSHNTVLITVACINYAMMLLSLYPILKICGHIGLKNPFVRTALAAVPLLHSIYLQTAAYALNDGIFRALLPWLIYSYFLCYEQYCRDRHIPGWNAKVVGIFLFAAVICHFRIDSIVITVMFSISALLTGKYKLFLLMSAFAAAMIISITGFYSIFHASDFSQYSSMRISAFFSDPAERLKGFFLFLFPVDMYGKSTGPFAPAVSFLCIGFYISFVAGMIKGYLKKDWKLLSVSLSVTAISAMIIVQGAMNDRYLLVILPFIYLLIFIRGKLRYIGFFFAILVVFNASRLLYQNRITVEPRVTFWNYVSEHTTLKNDNTFFISYLTRPAWYFTGIPVFTQYDFSLPKSRTYNFTFEQLSDADNIYLAGPVEFLEEQKNKILQLAGQNLYAVRFDLLTSDYSDSEGNGLYQIVLSPDTVSEFQGNSE